MSKERIEGELGLALDAGQRWVVWHSEDEPRAREELVEFAQRRELELRFWSIDQDPNAYLHFDQALDDARVQGPDTSRQIWVWIDFQPPQTLANRLQRKLRHAAQNNSAPPCVFIQFFDASTPRPPERFHVYQSSPGIAELAEHISRRCIGSALPIDPTLADELFEQRHEIAQRSVGLSYWQMDIALNIAGQHASPQARMAAIERYKSDSLNADRLVELCQPANETRLGGLDGYKAWLNEQKVAMSSGARQAGIASPRGTLLVGIPGCGKSLAARVTAHQLELPLYRLDLGRLFTGVLGGSEARMRQTLRLCERLAPAVLWIDEVEKGLSSGPGHGDSGTAQRSLATLMTWLQEHESPLFLVATANRIDELPPELTRRGRLDDTFFVDLPQPEERAAILEVYGVGDWQADEEMRRQVIARSEGYSGAELCGAVSQARLRAFIATRPPAWIDLLEAIQRTVPLSQSRRDEVERMRHWGQRHARNARGHA